MVRLDIAGFKSGERSQQFQLEPADLDLEKDSFTGIRLDAELNREGDRILVSIDIEGTAHLICDRTSELFSQEVRGTHSILFVPHDRVEALGQDADDVGGYEPSDTTIDVAEAARDTLLLSVPVRKIAPGAEDIEIQTSFGNSGSDDDDIDPRWEALRGLSDKT